MAGGVKRQLRDQVKVLVRTRVGKADSFMDSIRPLPFFFGVRVSCRWRASQPYPLDLFLAFRQGISDCEVALDGMGGGGGGCIVRSILL